MPAVTTIHDANALLVFSVGPVLCCAPTLTVEAVIMPPHIHKTPGSDRNNPGVFRHSSGMVSVVDVRQRFGVDEAAWVSPGRMIVTEIAGGHAGFLVDSIIDVILWPDQGWGPAPALVPGEVFKRTLMLKEQIHLYTDFEKLFHFRESGYLRAHIAMLAAKQKQGTVAPSGPEALAVSPEIKVQPADAIPLKQAEPEPEIRHPVATPAKSFQPACTHTAPPRKPVPTSHKQNHPGVATKPVATDLHRQNALKTQSIMQKTAANTRTPEIPVSNVTQAFEQNEKWPVPQKNETDNAAGKFILAGVIIALVAVVVFVLMSNNQPETTITHQPVAVISKAETLAAVSEMEAVENYQASVTKDAEGIVITIDAAPDEVIKQRPSSEVSIEKLLDSAQTKVPAVVAEEKIIIHVVKKGDTLWEIANRYVRDPWRYPELAKLSNIKNPHRIYPGNKVKIIMRTAGKTEPR